MKKIIVVYEGWGERWPLGTLADNGSQLLFEYSPQALEQGLELSPRHLKLRPQAYGDFPAHLGRLPGLIADALPDGWGLLLMDRMFRKAGRDPATLSPLDRLAFIDGRSLGALTFEPAEHQELTREEVQLLELATLARQVIADKDTDALRKLALLGGSPHGARPKVLVHYHAGTGAISTEPADGTQPWLVKFQAGNEHKEVCAVEQRYAQLARQCGLDMPDTRWFDLDRKLAAFGIARFDIESGLRVPMHTLAGLLHADFRLPGSVDYTTFLRATRMLTHSEVEVKKAYERALFNVLFNNRDDHPKNFSFRLDRRRHWQLAPCYDLSFSDGPGGEHQMDVCGEARIIDRTHLLDLARQGGLDTRWAATVIDRMMPVARDFSQVVAIPGIRRTTAAHICRLVGRNVNLLAA